MRKTIILNIENESVSYYANTFRRMLDDKQIDISTYIHYLKGLLPAPNNFSDDPVKEEKFHSVEDLELCLGVVSSSVEDMIKRKLKIVMDLYLESGSIVKAIKKHRELFNSGLMEAKNTIDTMLDEYRRRMSK